MYISEASGYLDLGGGLADRAGSLVWHWPVRERVKIIVGHSAFPRIRIYHAAREELVELPVSDLRGGGSLLRADELRQRLPLHTEADWAYPVIGACTELWRMLYLDGQGVEIYLEYDLPPGTYPETAVLVAVLEGLSELYETHMTSISLPLVAQRATQRVAGRALPLTGLLTSYFGQLGHVLPVRSQQGRTANRIAAPLLRTDVRAGEVHEATELPDDCYLVGVSLPGATDSVAIGQWHTAVSMAYSVIATRQGATPERLAQARRDGRYSELPYAGFLGTVDYEWMYRDYERLLPDTLTGSDFLAQYGRPIDPFARVEPDREYPVRRAGLLPIQLNFEYQQLLDQLTDVAAGALHGEDWSRRLGDRLARTYALQTSEELVTAPVQQLHDYLLHEGLEHRLYGAVLSGNHTLVVLAYGEAAVERVLERTEEFGEAHEVKVVVSLP